MNDKPSADYFDNAELSEFSVPALTALVPGGEQKEAKLAQDAAETGATSDACNTYVNVTLSS